MRFLYHLGVEYFVKEIRETIIWDSTLVHSVMLSPDWYDYVVLLVVQRMAIEGLSVEGERRVGRNKPWTKLGNLLKFLIITTFVD
jgi:hypothetical protein